MIIGFLVVLALLIAVSLARRRRLRAKPSPVMALLRLSEDMCQAAQKAALARKNSEPARPCFYCGTPLVAAGCPRCGAASDDPLHGS